MACEKEDKTGRGWGLCMAMIVWMGQRARLSGLDSEDDLFHHAAHSHGSPTCSPRGNPRGGSIIDRNHSHLSSSLSSTQHNPSVLAISSHRTQPPPLPSLFPKPYRPSPPHFRFRPPRTPPHPPGLAPPPFTARNLLLMAETIKTYACASGEVPSNMFRASMTTVPATISNYARN